MQKSLSVFEYLQMSNDVSQILIEKSKNLSWHELNTSADREIVKIRRKVGEIRSEIHRMRGFVRFNSINGNILFGYMKPKNNIGRLITDIFAKRFQENIIILGNEKKVWISYYCKNIHHRHEESRNLSEVINEVKSLVGNNQEIDTKRIWEVYYNSQYIKERENHKLFYKNMPKKHLKSAGNDFELRLNSSTLDEYIQQ